MLEVEIAVDGDRVVQRGAHRPAVVDHAEQAGAEALVVVDQVEVAPPGLQHPAGADAERPRLGEPGAAHDAELADVDLVPELPRPGHPEGVAGG